MRAWLLLALLAGATPGWAQEVRVTARLDHPRIGLGKTVELTLDVLAPDGVQLALPSPQTLHFPPFDVLQATRTSLGGQSAQYQVKLGAYQDGHLTVPPLQIDYRGADGVQHQAVSPSLAVEVQRVAAVNDKLDIRDLKQMQDVPTPWWMFLSGSGLLACLVAVALGLWLQRCSRRVPKTPHELALEALRRLEAEDLPAHGQVKLHYDRLAAILRGYLARRFELPVLEHTTGEVVQMLHQRGFQSELCDQVAPVLLESDLVKFAQLRVAHPRALAQLKAVRGIVEQTVETAGKTK